ncbi:MAG: hypothetical protein J3K34DRAFT_460754 [Monoraphidium minutum]|nr:MAG: hypothetical protein J3K34DRAFT_460754 [Monoraphidium minutum]
MKPHFAPARHAPGPHHHWHGHNARWRRHALLIIGAVAGLVLAANFALMVPLLQRHPDGGRGGAAAPGGGPPQENFLEAFDADGDGVLDGGEFSRIVAEVCSLDLGRLPFWQRVRKLLDPRFYLSSPCASAQVRTRLSGAAPHPPKRAAPAPAPAAAPAAAAPSGGGKGEPQKQQAALEGCPALSPELLESLAVQKTVLLVAADWAAWDVFGVNWLAHVQRAGITNYLVAALDQKTADFLVTNKLGHCTSWGSPLPAQAEPFKHGSDAHRAASWARLEAAESVVAAGYDVIVATSNEAGDAGLEARPAAAHAVAASVVFVRSSPGGRAALKALQQHRRGPPPAGGAGEERRAEYESPGEEGGEGDGPAYAAGPAAAGAAAAAVAGADGSGAGAAVAQQHPSDALRAWLRGSPALSAEAAAASPLGGSPQAKRLLRLAPPGGAGGGLGGWLGLGAGGGDGEAPPASINVGVFSPAVVQHGYTSFVSKLHEAQQLPQSDAPLAVHFSWSGRSKESRLHRMREAMWYADGPTYYTDPLLLTYDAGPLETPANFSAWTDGEEMLQVHIRAMEAQLAEFYSAAAIAVTLGRTLVLPQFWCHCYRHNAPTAACRAPGDARSALPFVCTLEQMFKPRALYAHLPAVDGKRLMFREHSFLDNRRTPGWVKHARTEVFAGEPRCGDPGLSLCVEVNNTRPPRRVNQQVRAGEQVTLPAGVDEAQIADLLKPYAKAKLLHIAQPSLLFGGFKHQDQRSQFEIWIDTILAPWCCRTPEEALKHGAMRFARMRARRELAAPRPKPPPPAADAPPGRRRALRQLPAPRSRTYERAALITEVLAADSRCRVTLSGVDPWTRTAELRALCRWPRAKLAALATLLDHLKPQLAGFTSLFDVYINAGVFNARDGARVPGAGPLPRGDAAARKVMKGAFGGNPLFSKSLIVTAARAGCGGTGHFAFFAPTVVRPPSCGGVAVVPGAAGCSYSAAAAFEAAFDLKRALGAVAVTARATAVAGGAAGCGAEAAAAARPSRVERAHLVAAVMAGDKDCRPSLAEEAGAQGAKVLRLLVRCKTADAKTRALADLLAVFSAGTADAEGGSSPASGPSGEGVAAGAAPRVEASVVDGHGNVLKSQGLPVNEDALLRLARAAFAANPLFASAERYDPPNPTSCHDPGRYAFFKPALVQPGACGGAPPAPGAAACSYLAHDAFERAFDLSARLGLRAVMLQPPSAAGGEGVAEGAAAAGGGAGEGAAAAAAAVAAEPTAKAVAEAAEAEAAVLVAGTESDAPPEGGDPAGAAGEGGGAADAGGAVVAGTRGPDGGPDGGGADANTDGGGGGTGGGI